MYSFPLNSKKKKKKNRFSPYDCTISILHSPPNLLPKGEKEEKGEEKGEETHHHHHHHQKHSDSTQGDLPKGEQEKEKEKEGGGEGGEQKETALNFEDFPWIALLRGGKFLYLSFSSSSSPLSRSLLRPALLSFPFLPPSPSLPSPALVHTSFTLLEKLKGKCIYSEQDLLAELKTSPKVIQEALLFCHSLVCEGEKEKGREKERGREREKNRERGGFGERLVGRRREGWVREVVKLWVANPILKEQLLGGERKRERERERGRQRGEVFCSSFMGVSSSSPSSSSSFSPSFGSSPLPSFMPLPPSSYHSPPRSSLPSFLNESPIDPSSSSSLSSSPFLNESPLDPSCFPPSPSTPPRSLSFLVGGGGGEGGGAKGMFGEGEQSKEKEIIENIISSSLSSLSSSPSSPPLEGVSDLLGGEGGEEEEEERIGGGELWGEKKEGKREAVKGVAQGLYLISLIFSCQLFPFDFLLYAESCQKNNPSSSLPSSILNGLLYEKTVKEWVIKNITKEKEEKGEERGGRGGGEEEEQVRWYEFFGLVCRESFELGDISTSLAIVEALTSAEVLKNNIRRYITYLDLFLYC